MGVGTYADSVRLFKWCALVGWDCPPYLHFPNSCQLLVGFSTNRAWEEKKGRSQGIPSSLLWASSLAGAAPSPDQLWYMLDFYVGERLCGCWTLKWASDYLFAIAPGKGLEHY